MTWREHKRTKLVLVKKIYLKDIQKWLPVQVDRLLWLFLVLVFLGASAALTWNFWSQWRSEQVNKSNSQYDFHCNVLPGDNNPKEHDQACHRRSLPCSYSLRLWSPHEPSGEEVGEGLQELAWRETQKWNKHGGDQKRYGGVHVDQIPDPAKSRKRRTANEHSQHSWHNDCSECRCLSY